MSGEKLFGLCGGSFVFRDRENVKLNKKYQVFLVNSKFEITKNWN